MEEWIRREKIVFPKQDEERVVTWNSIDELVEAIKAGDVPVTPKKKNPLFSLDTPDLEFWIGKPVGFGRPGFKKHWEDLRSHVNPVGSWVARLNEDGNEDDYITLRSKEAGEGTGVIEKIFGTKAFSYPKPPSLMQQLVEQSTSNDDIVLDFFAGSGTTAHATLLQNVEDSQMRRFIMVSNTESSKKDPDKNLCRDVCAKRISSVITGYGEQPPAPGDFAYLRTRRIPQGRMLGIEHEQVWTALQMTHRETLLPFSDEPYLISPLDDEAMVYVPRFSRELAAVLKKALKGFTAVVLYSWQPDMLAQHVRTGNIQFEAIPESLARRFGMKG